jgi:hypothetical protein
MLDSLRYVQLSTNVEEILDRLCNSYGALVDYWWTRSQSQKRLVRRQP